MAPRGSGAHRARIRDEDCTSWRDPLDLDSRTLARPGRPRHAERSRSHRHESGQTPPPISTSSVATLGKLPTERSGITLQHFLDGARDELWVGTQLRVRALVSTTECRAHSRSCSGRSRALPSGCRSQFWPSRPSRVSCLDLEGFKKRTRQIVTRLALPLFHQLEQCSSPAGLAIRSISSAEKAAVATNTSEKARNLCRSS